MRPTPGARPRPNARRRREVHDEPRGGPRCRSGRRVGGPDAGLDAPHLVTELPGPKARAHIAFDERYTSPSLPAAYPIRSRSRSRVGHRGHRREPVPRLLRRDRGQRDRPCAPARRGGDRPAGRGAAPLQRLGLLPAHLRPPPRGRSWSGSRPIHGPSRVFLGNSGTEVVEAAIKLARYSTGRPYLVSFLGGFHGRTYGSVSLTASKAKYHAHFGPLLPGVYHVPFGSAGLDELEQRVFHRLVPGERGRRDRRRADPGRGRDRGPGRRVPAPPASDLRSARILLVADEVQSGMGRTGRMWAIQHWGVEPDVILTAKGLASGMPIGRDDRPEHLMTWSAGAHGSTFGGNPVSSPRRWPRLRSSRTLDRERGPSAASRFRRTAAAHGSVPGSCPGRAGKGLLVGVQFDSGATAAAVEHAAFQRGLMVLTRAMTWCGSLRRSSSASGRRPPAASLRRGRPPPSPTAEAPDVRIQGRHHARRHRHARPRRRYGRDRGFTHLISFRAGHGDHPAAPP